MGNRVPSLPRELTEQDRWVRWRRAHGSKIPIQLDGKNASSADAATWTTFRAASRSGIGDGLGFVLGGGIGCVDLDHALINDQLTPGARKILDSLPASYTEISPSGDGLHVWLLMPHGKGRVLSIDGQKTEIYPPESGRYITVTHRPFNRSHPLLASCDATHLLG